MSETNQSSSEKSIQHPTILDDGWEFVGYSANQQKSKYKDMY